MQDGKAFIRVRCTDPALLMPRPSGLHRASGRFSYPARRVWPQSRSAGIMYLFTLTFMTPNQTPRVMMFVRNNCKNDARVLKEAASLRKAGLDVHIIATLTDTDQFEEVRDGVRITRVPVTTVRHPLGRALEWTVIGLLKLLYLFEPLLRLVRRRIGKAGPPPAQLEEWVTLEDRFRAIFSYHVRALRIALRQRADAYHGHDLNALWPAYLAARFHRVPVIYDSHELFAERNTRDREGWLLKTFFKLQEKFLIRRVDAVITVCESIATELANRYGLRKHPDLIMNCPPYVDPPEGADSNLLRHRLGLADATRIVLYIGGITFNRGLENLIQSIPRIERAVLVMMGPGVPSYVRTLQRLAEQTGVADRVYFLPPVPHREVASYAASADLSVHPILNVCLNHYYCLPNKLFESIMAGLPVAVSNFPEMNRVVTAWDIGVLFDPEDPANIAAAINRVLGDDVLRQRMRENTRKAALRYHWGHEEIKLLEIYRRVGLLREPQKAAA